MNLNLFLYFCTVEIEEQKDIVSIARLMDTIRDIRKVVRIIFMKKMKSHNIDVTIEMIEVLYILWNKDQINQQEIVDKTNRNKASITSIIDNMTARGLVQRNADPHDRRNNLIALTEEGRMYQMKLAPLLDEVYATFQGSISAQDLDNTTAVLKRLLQGMTCRTAANKE